MPAPREHITTDDIVLMPFSRSRVRGHASQPAQRVVLCQLTGHPARTLR